MSIIQLSGNFGDTLQALQEKPQENTKNKNARRTAIAEAQGHFRSKFGVKPPGITLLETFRTNFYIALSDQDEFNKNMHRIIIQLGQFVTGDEKLMRYLGACGYLRKVPNKPDKLGHWHYELTCQVCVFLVIETLHQALTQHQLSNGKPFLLYARTHASDKTVGKSIPTSEIVGEWADIVLRLGTPQTMLVFDSYYLDNAGRNLLLEKDVKFVASVQAHRFERLTDLVKHKVEKPGQQAGVYKPETAELFVHVWDHNKDIGKKYVYSNAFTRYDEPEPNIRPAYDAYKHMFNVCDQFNRSLHDRKWPHRNGAGGCPGTDLAIHDFFMSALLINVLNVKSSITSSTASDYKADCTELADQLFERSLKL